MASLLLQHDEQEAMAKVAATRQVRGSLELDFQVDLRWGSTFLAASAQEPPLRIVRPFRLEDGSVLVHLHNVSGGLLGGDCLHTTVNLGPNASAQLTSTGATRVYRSRPSKPATTQCNKLTVGRNALLEYVPDPVIPFAKARFKQVTTVDLAPGAGLFWWEILAPGRWARGEAFEYDSVEFRTKVAAAGHPIVAENIRLEPQLRELSSVARLGPYRYWVTFYIVREGLAAAAWPTLEARLRETLRPFQRPDEALWSVSTLAAHGVAVRALARHGWHLLTSLRSVWKAAKLLLYGREAVPPRKVN